MNAFAVCVRSCGIAARLSLAIIFGSLGEFEVFAAQVGVTAVGTTNYPNGGMFEAPPIKLGNDNHVSCSITNTAGTTAWFGTRTSPAIIIRYDVVNMQRLDSLELLAGENNASAALIDKQSQFGYFALDTVPAKIVKVNLATMTRVGAITLPAGEEKLTSAIINSAGTAAYFGTDTEPGKIIRINLSTFQRSGALTLPGTDSHLQSAAIDTAGQFGYFGTFQTNARVVKINLAALTRTSSLEITGLNNICDVQTEQTGTYLYACGMATNGRLVRLDLSTFTVDGTPLDLQADEDNPGAFVINPAGTRGAVGCESGKIVAINLTSFTRPGSVQSSAPALVYAKTAFYSAATPDHLWLVSDNRPSTIMKFEPSIPDLDYTFLHGGEDSLGINAMNADGTRLWFGTYARPSRVIEFDPQRNRRLIAFGNDPNMEGSVVGLGLDSSEQNLFVASDSYIFDGNGSRVVQFPLSTHQQLTSLAFSATPIRTMATDAQNNVAYLGGNNGNNAAMHLRTIQLNPPNYGVADLDLGPLALPVSTSLVVPGEAYFFATSSVPALLYRLAPNFSSIIGAPIGNGACRALLRSPQTGLLYAGLSSSPAQIVEIDGQSGGSAPSVNQTLTLNASGKEAFGVTGGAMDPAGRFALFTSGPQKLVRSELSAFSNYSVLPVSNSMSGVALDPDGDKAWVGFSGFEPLLGRILLSTRDQIHATKIKLTEAAKVNSFRWYAHSAVGPRRTWVERMEAGEDALFCGVINRTLGRAYFGTATTPGRVIAFDVNTRERVAGLTLDAGENSLYCAAITPNGANIYFGTYTTPGRVIRVRGSDLQKTGSLPLQAGENNLVAAVIDPAGVFLYLVASTSPAAQIIKVRLSDFTRVGALTLQNGEELSSGVAIDPLGQFLYVTCSGIPGRVVKVQLSNFTRHSHLPMNSDEWFLQTLNIDATGTSMYVGVRSIPGEIVRVRLSNFTRNGDLTLGSGENIPYAGAFTLDGKSLVFACDAIPAQIARIDTATFTRKGGGPLRAETEGAPTSLLPDNNGWMWTGCNKSPGRVVGVEPEPKPLRLAVYREVNQNRTLAWQSAATAVDAPGWLDIPISGGSPANLNLTAGNYWLAWQCDASERVPSYAPGNAGDGLVAYWPYGSFPATLNSSQLTNYAGNADRWSQYLVYDSKNQVQGYTDWE